MYIAIYTACVKFISVYRFSIVSKVCEIEICTCCDNNNINIDNMYLKLLVNTYSNIYA